MSRFADLIGQQLASKVLLKAIKEGRIMNSYLFTGPGGTGKTTAALALASALNCEHPDENGDACGECVQCRLVSSGGHPDIQLISPSGAQTKIEQMRDMRRSANFAPVMGKWKVVIVEQADTLNEAAANSILKILEEPPSYLVIVLLSRNPTLILPTIRSRCLLIRFSNANAEELIDALINRFGVNEEEAKFLTAYSEGRPGIAISLVGNESFFEWRRKMVELALRLATSGLKYALRLSEDLQNLAQAEKDGKTQRAATIEVFDGLVFTYRDLLNISIRGDSADIINSDLRDALASVRMDPRRISESIETLLWARKAVEGNANIQSVVDVTVMKLLRGR